MNRAAIISDMHANLPALQASLEAVDAIGVDAVCCGGDLVGHGPHPNEVCALIEQREIPKIYGNYDYAIGRDLAGCGCAYVTEHDRELGQRSVAWTLVHADQPTRTSCARWRLTCASSSPSSGWAWCTGRRGRSTNTCFRTSPRARRSGSPPARIVTCWCSVTPTSRGPIATAG